MKIRKLKHRLDKVNARRKVGIVSYVIIPPDDVSFEFDELVAYANDGTRMFGFTDKDGSVVWTREDEMPKGELGIIHGMTIKVGNEHSKNQTTAG